jgi:DNA adenine methylase
LEVNDALGAKYVEPYAGGAGIALELLFDQKVSHVYLNDSSPLIYSFWYSILTETDRFCGMISRARLTIEAWKKHREVVRHPADHDVVQVGFSTFYLNRCNRSGVLKAGVIGGLGQSGSWKMDARFSRRSLLKRIESLAEHRSKITVTNDDAAEFMVSKVNALPPKTIVYCDPPYYEGADRLYLNTYRPEDHAHVAAVIQRKLRHPWLVSYDGHPDIIDLYRNRLRFRYSLQYSAMRSCVAREVFFLSDSLELPRTSMLPYIARGLRYQRRSA